MSKQGIEVWFSAVIMRVKIKNGNKAGSTLVSQIFNPLSVACMHELGLITNNVIDNKIIIVKIVLDFVFNI